MRVLHCSDFHLLPRIRSVPISDWISKRATGALNLWWERKGQFALTPKKLDKLAEFARDQAVDAVLCTGDYTLWGTEQEHENARRAVQPLIEATTTSTPSGSLTSGDSSATSAICSTQTCPDRPWTDLGPWSDTWEMWRS